jgi:pyruvate carboxylase
VREFYYPFECELKAGTAEVYRHEIPGGQYSNLRPQARGLGLEDQFETIKTNYEAVNHLFGDLIKVTPSSKVVGDMAMFMTSNGYTAQDITEKGHSIDFPDSVKNFFRGNLGQPHAGFPKELQKMVLKEEMPFTERPNAHLAPIDFEEEFKQFQDKFDVFCTELDFISYKLYPKVFSDYYNHFQQFNEVRHLDTLPFFYGLKQNEETIIEIDNGKNILIRYISSSMADEDGIRNVTFELNGQMRSVKIKDETILVDKVSHRKAIESNEIGAPLQGSLSQILVEEGDVVDVNTPLFVIEAMKMESTITATVAGTIKKIHLPPKTLVAQDDLIIELTIA